MTTGFGDVALECPDNETGHVWSPPDRRLVDRRKPGNDTRVCVHCGVLASEHLNTATAARSEFFSTLRAPKSGHGSPRKP